MGQIQQQEYGFLKCIASSSTSVDTVHATLAGEYYQETVKSHLLEDIGLWTNRSIPLNMNIAREDMVWDLKWMNNFKYVTWFRAIRAGKLWIMESD